MTALDTVDVLDADSSTADLDVFCEKLLDTLYELGLMPCTLTRKAASYEKYPQELFTRIEIKRQYEKSGLLQAFDEWRTSVLRKTKYSQMRQDGILKLSALRAWVEEHDQVLLNKQNVRHLRKSMLGRTFVYLYPRLTLIFEYRDYCRDHDLLKEMVKVQTAEDRYRDMLKAVADEDFIAEHLPKATPVTQVQIADALGPNAVEPCLHAARAFLVQTQFYFDGTFKRQPRDSEELDDIDISEERI